MASIPSCWVCTELPTAASAGLPWWIRPASAADRTWLQNEFSTLTTWNYTKVSVVTGTRGRGHKTKPWTGYAIWDSVRRLSAMAVELLIPTLWCFEKYRGTEPIGWVPTSLCQKVTVENVTRGNGSRVIPVPSGTLCVCGVRGWL